MTTIHLQSKIVASREDPEGLPYVMHAGQPFDVVDYCEARSLNVYDVDQISLRDVLLMGLRANWPLLLTVGHTIAEPVTPSKTPTTSYLAAQKIAECERAIAALEQDVAREMRLTTLAAEMGVSVADLCMLAQSVANSIKQDNASGSYLTADSATQEAIALAYADHACKKLAAFVAAVRAI